MLCCSPIIAFERLPLLLSSSEAKFTEFCCTVYDLCKETAKRWGRISSSVRLRSSSVIQLFRISSRLSESITKASLQPVRMPRYIRTFHSLRGVPTASIFLLMLCSIEVRIIHGAESLFKFCSVTFLSPPVSPFPQPNRT